MVRSNSNLTANSNPFKFGYENGQYGYYLPDGEGGADTLHPFKSDLNVVYNQTGNEAGRQFLYTVPSEDDGKYGIVVVWSGRADTMGGLYTDTSAWVGIFKTGEFNTVWYSLVNSFCGIAYGKLNGGATGGITLSPYAGTSHSGGMTVFSA